MPWIFKTQTKCLYIMLLVWFFAALWNQRMWFQIWKYYQIESITITLVHSLSINFNWKSYLSTQSKIWKLGLVKWRLQCVKQYWKIFDNPQFCFRSFSSWKWYFAFRTTGSSLSRVFLEKRFSENIQQIYRITPMPKCDLNKFEILIMLKFHTSAWVFSVNLLHVFRTPFLINTSGRLPLERRSLAMFDLMINTKQKF